MVTLLSSLLCTPVAFFTCYSGGLLLPVGIIILTMIMANFSGLVAFGPYFPWSITGLFGVSSVSGGGDHLVPVSYFILVLASLAGGTLLWWYFADHK